MTFADLNFNPHQRAPGFGVVARAFFPNGYGASVICGPYSYGGDAGLYELAVLAGSEAEFALTYETPITDDVEGHLSPDDVTALLERISALPTKLAA